MDWLNKCFHWKNKWTAEESINALDGIDLYEFIINLNMFIRENDSIVVDAGSTGYVTGQALKLKSTNRYICSGGQLDMGFAIPASIGVALAKTKGNTIVMVGDGGFQTNIQELAVIKHLNLPIKIFVWNNNGYLSIRNTQNNFYSGNLMGCDAEHGLWFPALIDIAETYHIPYCKMTKINDYNHYGELILPHVLYEETAYIIEVICSENQKIIPTAMFKDGKQVSLSQMYPFLSEEEYEKERAY